MGVGAGGGGLFYGYGGDADALHCGMAGAAAPRRYRGIVGAGADAAHLHTGRQKPRRGALAAVLRRKKPIDCDIGILRYEVEGIYRVESTAAGRTTKDYK